MMNEPKNHPSSSASMRLEVYLWLFCSIISVFITYQAIRRVEVGTIATERDIVAFVGALLLLTSTLQLALYLFRAPHLNNAFYVRLSFLSLLLFVSIGLAVFYLESQAKAEQQQKFYQSLLLIWQFVLFFNISLGHLIRVWREGKQEKEQDAIPDFK